MKKKTQTTKARTEMKETQKFVCHYQHDGTTWSLNIDAYDWADAETRVKKLGYLQLDGELMGTVPARFGFVAKFICWIRNLTKGLK